MELKSYESIKNIIENRIKELKNIVIHNLSVFSEHLKPFEEFNIFFNNFISQLEQGEITEFFSRIPKIRARIAKIAKIEKKSNLLLQFDIIGFKISLLNINFFKNKLKQEFIKKNLKKKYFEEMIHSDNKNFDKILNRIAEYNLAYILSGENYRDNNDFFKKNNFYNDYIELVNKLNEIASQQKYIEYSKEFQELLSLKEEKERVIVKNKKELKRKIKKKEFVIYQNLNSDYFVFNKTKFVLRFLYILIYLLALVLLFYLNNENWVFEPFYILLMIPGLFLNVLLLRKIYLSNFDLKYRYILLLYLVMLLVITRNGFYTMFAGLLPFGFYCLIEFWEFLSIKGKIIKSLLILENSSEYLIKNPKLQECVKENFKDLLKALNLFLSKSGSRKISNMRKLENKFADNLQDRKYYSKYWLKFFSNSVKINFLTNISISPYYYKYKTKEIFIKRERIFQDEIDNLIKDFKKS